MSTKKNFIYNSLLGLTNVLVPVITFPYVSRILGPEGIGLTSFAISLATTFIVLASLGIPIYGIREVAKVKNDKERLSKTFSELLAIHLIWSFIVLIIFSVWLMFTKTYQNELIIKYLSFIHIFASVGLINWFYQGIEQYKFISVINFISKILTIVLLFVLVKKPEDYWVYYLIIVLSNFVSVLISVFYSFNFVRFKFVGFNFKLHLKPIIILFSTQLAISIYVNLDVIMLKYFSEIEQVGYYSAAIRIVKILLIIITSLGVVLIPKISTFIKEKKTIEVKQLIEKSINFVLILSFPVVVILCILSKKIIKLFAGIEFVEAHILVKLLSPLIIIIGLANIFALQILVPSNKEKKYMYAVLIALLVNIVLNGILIPVLASKGAVIATILTELTGLIITFFYSKALINFKFPIKKAIQYALISSILLPLSVLISTFVTNDIWYLVVFLICSGCVYGLFLLVLKDVFFIENMVNPIIFKLKGNK